METLTEQQRQIILKWFDEKAPLVGRCPICNHREWRLQPHIVTPPIFADGGMSLGGTSYPFIMLTCHHCGNTQFHNAVVIGLLKDDPEPAPEPQAAESQNDGP